MLSLSLGVCGSRRAPPAGSVTKACVCACVCVSSTAPVREEALRVLRKSITNQQLDLYNQAAADVFGGGSRRRGSGGGSSSSDSGVRLLASPRLAAAETMSLSEDGLHLPDSANNVVGGTCLESRVGLSIDWNRGPRHSNSPRESFQIFTFRSLPSKKGSAASFCFTQINDTSALSARLTKSIWQRRRVHHPCD